MRCGGRGLCGCGQKICQSIDWWIAFDGFWWQLAGEIQLEQDAIRYYTELLTS